ncbi:MAG: phosphatase PAP2 family protein [Terracidiphilus sp.]
MLAVRIFLIPALIGIGPIILALIWMLKDQKDKIRAQLVIALILNFFYGLLLEIFMGHEGSLLPWKYDNILLHIDASLGIRAIAVAGHLPGFMHAPLWIIYEMMLPMMIAWIFVASHSRFSGSIILAYVAELVTAPLIYTIVPACGPGWAFGKQWLSPPAVAAVPVRLTGDPNAFPSLHVATAFLFVLYAPGRLWKTVAILFLAGTCLATLSTGEHYVIDMIPGLAFGAFAAAFGFGQRKRARFFLAVVLFWSLLVRFSHAFLIANPIVIRSLALITLALVALLLWDVWRAAPPTQDSRIESNRSMPCVEVGSAYSGFAVTVSRSHDRQVDFSSRKIHPPLRPETATPTAKPL